MKYVHIMATKLTQIFEQQIIVSPNGQKQLEPTFYAAFPRVSTLIDCTEIKMQKSKSLQYAKNTFSNYKVRFLSLNSI